MRIGPDIYHKHNEIWVGNHVKYSLFCNLSGKWPRTLVTFYDADDYASG